MVAQKGEELRQAVFGANDGLVSTFGLVAGLTGAAASPSILIIANVVNMFASGMSMGFGSYLATKSQYEYNKRLEAEERHRIRTDRKEALKELRKLFTRRGVPKSQLKRHMDTVTDDEKEWLAFVLQEKHGLAKAGFPNPIRGGTIMFFVFVACGFIPIIPLFFASGMQALMVSAFITSIALFVVGALKHELTGRSWTSLGLENLSIGAVTGIVGFIAGIITSDLLGGAVIG
jgi:VIT1/CCC1 family predicted Fe2+/Mn2+ transporter